MRYMQAKDMISEEKKIIFKKCVEIGNRLISKGTTVPEIKQTVITTPTTSVVNCEQLLNELINLSNCSNTAQSRGFAFEKYLKNLFETFGLNPRSSFKINGEQIDGSFVMHNEVYLIEAKWTNKKVDKGELVVFNEKVSSKSGFTRGLFISYSGYSDEALDTFSNGRTVNIILMTVEELAITLSRNLDFATVLSAKVRALAEEGDFNKSIFNL